MQERVVNSGFDRSSRAAEHTVFAVIVAVSVCHLLNDMMQALLPAIYPNLKADFGRWLRQSDQAHKDQAAQVGISLDSGPGAARAAFGQMDADTLRDRGIIIAGNPESCIKGVQLYEEAGVDQVILVMQTEIMEHETVLKSLEMFGKYVIPAFREKGARQPAAVAGS